MSDRTKLKNYDGIEVPEEIQNRLKTIPLAHQQKSYKFEDWQDKVLLDLWKTHNKKKVADAIGVGYNTCLERYRFLTKKDEQ